MTAYKRRFYIKVFNLDRGPGTVTPWGNTVMKGLQQLSKSVIDSLYVSVTVT